MDDTFGSNALHLGICIPSLGTHLTETAVSLTAMAILNENNGIHQSIINQQQASISYGRNRIAQDAIKAGTDYTLWIDADMGFPPYLALQLLNHGKDIVGATYAQRMPPYITNGRFHHGFGPGLAEAEFLPFGAMLVKTEVFRKIPEPWFYESYRFYGTGTEQLSQAFRCSANIDFSSEFISELETLIDRYYPVEAEGRARQTAIRGEDANFCRGARLAGYTVWCDTDLSRKIQHIGRQGVTLGDAEAMPGDEKLSTAKAA